MIEPHLIDGGSRPRRPPRRWLSEAAKRRCAIGLVVILATASLCGEVCENFHTVIAGCVYRSGQLSPASLESHVAQKHIRSVINLRGANPGDDWYEQECAVAQRHGLRHYDLPLDSLFPPTGQDLHELIVLLDSCPKPVLIHCQSGIDRSGMVAAICILLLDEHGTPDQALTQLSWRFGHLPWQENRVRLKAFVQGYQDWLEHKGFTHNPSRFQEWACQE
jgi:undecaprenyl-diphosphatase